ncbi:MAG TPA: DUF1501 domain-containing protein [Planctomycetota bacterium]|nr:DUF1501 domain-containing protein [Planctomycetota bacterium]
MNLHPQDIDMLLRRRAFLGHGAFGLGSLAFSLLSARRSATTTGASLLQDPAPAWRLPEAKARRVVVVFLSGGLAQHDLFDEKPLLKERRGEELPPSIRKGERITGLTERQGALPVVGSKFEFSSQGKCGMRMSELLPHLGAVADELTLIRSVQTDHVLHEAAMTILFTGTQLLGRPSWGAWTSYALGDGKANLPEFVVMLSNPDSATPLHPRLWHNGFLEGRHQGVPFRGGAEPVLFVKNPPGVDDKVRARQLAALKELDQLEAARTGDPDALARLASFETAARMQTSVPELADLSKEPPEVIEEYGAEAGKESFANNCLMARRLLERGVRFVQLCDAGWDHHYNIPRVLPRKCEQVDKPVAALIRDLRRRGMLDDTIVVFAGEFGRTPYCEGPLAFDSYGRDHNALACSVLVAGGGFRPGYAHGKTDDWGWSATEDIVHVHDLHATILHQLGLDHLKLTVRSQGRDFRLTDVAGKVVKELLA